MSLAQKSSPHQFWVRRGLLSAWVLAAIQVATTLVGLVRGSERASLGELGRTLPLLLIAGFAFGAVHGWMVVRASRPIDSATSVAAGLVAGGVAGLIFGVLLSWSHGGPMLGAIAIGVVGGLLFGIPISFTFDAPERRQAAASAAVKQGQ